MRIKEKSKSYIDRGSVYKHAVKAGGFEHDQV